MAHSKYPESGLSAVLDLTNWSSAVRSYLADVDRLNKADATSERSAERSSAAKDKYTRALKFASDAAKAAVSQFQAAGNAIERSGQSAERSSVNISRFTERLIQIDAGIRILNTASDAIGRIAEGVADMAGRAMRVEGISRAFRSVVAPVGDASRVLEQWREQAQHAVSDLDLMRMGNVALLNTTRESRAVISEGFGVVVRAAFAGAAATGQDFNVVLEKMTLGLRRQSNMLLDDIGVMVSAEEANRRYAESHGLIVSQMNDAQRAAAWQAEAIRQMSNVLMQTGNAGITYIQRASTEWQNALDAMAVATEVGVGRMDYGLGRVFSGIAALVDQAAPYVGVFAEEIGSAFAMIGDNVYGLLSQLNPADFFTGGANIIAALAHGILSGLTLVVQAANVIAQSIANLLVGFSPPPEGPLSAIDVGGQKVIEAWLAGFEKVSVAPAEQLAARVNDILSSVGNLGTKGQITVLEQLQKRIQGRLESAVASMMRGEGGADVVRALDSQRVALAKQLDLLRERAALEQVGVNLAADDAAFRRESLHLSRQERSVSDQSARKATAERDRLAELQEKLRENRRLQDAYLGYGRDTTDLLREELRLRQQIADETIARGGNAAAMLADVDALTAELERRQRRTRSGGAGAAVATATTEEEEFIAPLPAAQQAAAGMSMAPAEIRAQFAGRDAASTMRGRLQAAFSGISSDYAAFVDELNRLQDTLSGIDLFGSIQDFLEQLGEDPGAALRHLAEGIGDIVAAIPQGIETIINGIADEIERITGIHISEGFREAGSLLAGIGAAAEIATPLIAAVAGAIGGLIMSVAPIALPMIALGLLFDFINQKFGSFENALSMAGQTLRGMGGIISVAWDDMRAAIEEKWAEFQLWWSERMNELDTTLEGIGIDIIPDVNVDEARARVEAYRARGEIQAAVATAITTGGPLQLSPEIIAGVRDGHIQVPERTRLLVQSAIEDALRAGDRNALNVAATAALDLGITLPPDLAAQVREQIGVNLAAPIEAGVVVRLTERGYEWDGHVYGTLEGLLSGMDAQNPVGLTIQNGSATIQITEQGYEVNGQTYGNIEAAIQASMPAEISTHITARPVVDMVATEYSSLELYSPIELYSPVELTLIPGETLSSSLDPVTRARMLVQDEIERALQAGDTEALGIAVSTALQLGITVPPDVPDEVTAQIQASMPTEVNPHVTVRPTIDLVWESSTEYSPAGSTQAPWEFMSSPLSPATRAGGGIGGFGALPTGGGQLMSARDAVQAVGPLIDVIRARYVSDVVQPFQEQFTGWTEQVSADAASTQDALSTFFDTSLVGLEELEAELLNAQADVSLVDTATLDLATSVAVWYGEAGRARSTLGELAGFLETPYFRAVEVAKNITEGLAAALERVVEAQQMSGYGPASGIPYGGGRAGGGSVEPGHVYRVGENGPEWFMPNLIGQIIPERRLSPSSVIINVQPTPIIVDSGDTYNTSSTNWHVNANRFDASDIRRYYEMQARRL